MEKTDVATTTDNRRSIATLYKQTNKEQKKFKIIIQVHKDQKLNHEQ